MNLNLGLIKELIEMVTGSSLSSFEVECGDMRIKLENGTESREEDFVCSEHCTAGVCEDTENSKKHCSDECSCGNEDFSGMKVIKSPMVGTYHSLEAIKKQPLCIGDKVSSGSVVCVVEAMKLINEIESEFDGEILKILVNDGDMVEFGQPLFVVG